MRLLQLHSDFIEYEPIAKEIKDAEENVSKSKVRLEDLVVVLIAVENDDDESIAKVAVDEIKKYLDTVKSRRLLIYPYAHLSSNLASPVTAVEIIKSVEKIARESILMRFIKHLLDGPRLLILKLRDTHWQKMPKY